MAVRLPSAQLQGYRAGSIAAAMLPSAVSRGLGETAGVLAARSRLLPGRLSGLKPRREMVARHLKRVYGEDLGGRELEKLIDEVFASYGRYWADSLLLTHQRKSQILAHQDYEHYDRIAAGAAAGKGTILAVPHLGGWEWAGTQLALIGHEVSVVVEALEPPDVFEWFVSYRERLGMHVIPMGPQAAVACSQALRANHLLCLLCDRVVGDAASVEVEFFGERTQLPAGPVTLALRTGATLLPCAVYFVGRSGHLGVVRPPLQLERRGRLRDDVIAGTQALAAELEVLIRRAPTQWHLMQPNWPSDTAASGQ